ncbi:MAG: hypothetical protein QXG91_03030 [Candidatus Aenigmatarchaeota archaeon]
MKALIILAVLLFFSVSFSFPIIESVELLPSNNIYIGENLTVSVKCIDPNSTISRVYVKIYSNNLIFPTLDLDYSIVENKYKRTLENSYFDREDTFNVAVYCSNEENEANVTYLTLNVSRISSQIIVENLYYVGDVIELIFAPMINNEVVMSDIPKVYLNNQEKQLKQLPLFRINSGWILKIDAPSLEGSYELKIISNYNRAIIQGSKIITIKKPFQIEIFNLNNHLAKPKEVLTAYFKASLKGQNVELDKDNVRFFIGDLTLNITEFGKQGDVYFAKISIPDLTSSSYELKIIINYNGYTVSSSKGISILTPISINLPPGTHIEFLSNSYKFSFVSNNDGVAIGSIVLGNYDVKVWNNKATIILYNANINNTDNPINFREVDIEVEGFNNAGSYLFETSLSYERAYLELFYDENKVLDESKVKAFKCNVFNFAIGKCISSWIELNNFTLDTVKNVVRIFTDSLSLFLVGSEKNLNLEFSFDKQKYALEDLVKFSGYVVDEWNSRMKNINITIEVIGANIKHKTITNNDGVFSGSFIAPNKEGEFTVTVSAITRFSKLTKNYKLLVERKKEMFIIFPDSVKVSFGKFVEAEITIKNTGQANLTNITIEIEGIPKEYYRIDNSTIEFLETGKDFNTKVIFELPIKLNESSLLAKIKAVSNEALYEKSFGFSIIKEEQIITARVVEIPKVNISQDWLIILGIFLIFFSFLLGRIRKSREKRNISELKEEIEKALSKNK